jgi:hypothetical protein
VIKLAFLIQSNLKDERIDALSNPANGTVLVRNVRTLIEIVGPVKDLSRLLEPDTAAGIFPQPPTFLRIEVKAQIYNCYTILLRIASGEGE